MYIGPHTVFAGPKTGYPLIFVPLSTLNTASPKPGNVTDSQRPSILRDKSIGSSAEIFSSVGGPYTFTTYSSSHCPLGKSTLTKTTYVPEPPGMLKRALLICDFVGGICDFAVSECFFATRTVNVGSSVPPSHALRKRELGHSSCTAKGSSLAISNSSATIDCSAVVSSTAETTAPAFTSAMSMTSKVSRNSSNVQ